MKACIGAVIAILAVAAPALPVAAAAPSAGCSATTGVTVIVDFTHFPGGRVERGCAPGVPANALIALHAAGFTSAGTAQYGDAFVCRIDGLPSPQQDACVVTPSPTAYWAFWSARPSDSQWTYANVGVLDFHPQAGSIEAFAFGQRAEPSISPAAAIPPPASTTTTVAPPTTRRPPVTAATLPTGPTPTTAPVITLEPTTTPARATPPAPSSSKPKSKARSKSKSTPRSSTSTAPTRVPRSTSSTVPIVDRSAAGPIASRAGSGSPLGVFLAVVIIAGLGGGAFAFTRARRRRAA